MIKKLHPSLFVGSRDDAYTWIKDYPLGTIINVSKDVPCIDAPNVIHIKLADGPGNDIELVRNAVLAVHDLIEHGSDVFVHCSAGHSRSPAIACGAYALALKTNLSVPLEKIMRQDENVRPKDALLIHVLQVLADDRGLEAHHAHDPQP